MKFALLFFLSFSTFTETFAASQANSKWQNALKKEITIIDSEFDGNLGVYVKKLGDGSQLQYNSERKWYLASTVKVLIAMAFLKEVEKGKLSLSHEVILQRSDFVDGTGEVNWKEPGERLTASFLLEKMLTHSDSTAADILLRLVGVQNLNSYIRGWAPKFGPITSLLDVRYAAYSEVHPKAKSLTNMDFFEFKKVPITERLSVLAEKIKVSPSEFKTKTVEDAFERYYSKGLNSGSLKSFGQVLEKLALNKILSKEHTLLLLNHMENMKTGEKRIKAGLPTNLRFAQKTGTQVGRICNVGIIRNIKSESGRIVISACAEKFKEEEQAEVTLVRVGKALVQSGTIPAEE